jgi:arylsulfatase A-like enzyme
MLDECGAPRGTAVIDTPQQSFLWLKFVPLLSAHRWCVLLTISMVAALPAFAAQKPNILVILADDMGWGDLGINGNTDLSTPHLDSLAREGVSFDRFYVSPVCSPTRAEFLTGRYHPRSGVRGTSRGGERMNADERTIADVFKAAGYATASFGKWHGGANFPYHPNARGFEEFYGFCSGHWGDYFAPQLEHNGALVNGEGFVIDDFTNRAAAYITRQHVSGKPFFVFLSFNTPHSPMQVPDEWWGKFRDKELTQSVPSPKRRNSDHTRAALALCENIDWNVGRLLAKLDELDIADDTLVMFFSDNGPNGHRWNGGMKGIKGSVDEGGVRSPLLVRWPARLPKGKTITSVSAAIDLLPTLAEIAQVPLEGTKPLDGISLVSLLTHPETATASWPDRTIISHWNGKVSARTQRFRLDPEGRLFDMTADPGQQNDVAKNHPDTTRRMKASIAGWRNTVLTEPAQDPRSFIIAHPAVRWTRLPADDAIAHGGIRRSSVHPNCSYFQNWTSTDDRITWEVEVGAAGNYEVELWYACPQRDLGSTIELNLGNSRLTGIVTVAHDPPERGRNMERDPRTESYAKEFIPLKPGIIKLEKGPGTLTLRALEIPGNQAMEFRLLTLTRIE